MDHKGTKVLEKKRLILRPFTIEDAPLAYKNWCSDPQVTTYLSWPVHAELSVTEGVIGSWAASYENPAYYQWAIVPKDLGEPIGSIGAVSLTESSKTIHIGYAIGRPWWHQGVTSEALAELIRFFFEEVGAGRIESMHDPANPHSGQVMEKCGMRVEGVLRKYFLSNQGIVDMCMHSILREEYEAGK